MSKLKCDHCKKEFDERDHIVHCEDEWANLILLHYNCYEKWALEQFVFREAVILNGEVLDI